MAVSGDIQDIGLANLIRLLCNNKYSAVLTLQQIGAASGMLVCDSGKLVHASSEKGSGNDAVSEMLQWRYGVFYLKRSIDIQYELNVTDSWESLLGGSVTPSRNGSKPKAVPLEVSAGSQKSDTVVGPPATASLVAPAPPAKAREKVQKEANRNGASGSPPKQKPRRKVDPAKDDSLEYDLVTLLSRLDKTRADLVTGRSQKGNSFVLQQLVSIVNVTCESLQDNLKEEGRNLSLGRVVTKTGSKFPSARLLTLRNNRLDIKMLTNLYENWAGSTLNRRQMFREIGFCLWETEKTLLHLMLSLFTAEEMALQWRDTFSTFLEELKSIIDEIVF